MNIDANQALLFIGDSITDCGRGRPIGTEEELGTGYVSQVRDLLGSIYPEKSTRILNTGIGGNRITDLQARWQTDVLDLKPDWLSVMIGINDVWRQFDSPQLEQVLPEQFESVYRSLLEKTRPTLKGLVIMSPFFIESDLTDPMRARMDEYRGIVGPIADDFDATFIDTQIAFDTYLAHQPGSSLCDDRVHPNGVGHMILARAFLNGVDVDWSHPSA